MKEYSSKGWIKNRFSARSLLTSSRNSLPWSSSLSFSVLFYVIESRNRNASKSCGAINKSTANSESVLHALIESLRTTFFPFIRERYVQEQFY